MNSATHLGHVHLKVRALEPSVEFYEDILGLGTTERVGRFAFLTLGSHHHDLALQAVGDENEADDAGEGVAPGRPEPGLYHHAWEFDDETALAAAAKRLEERGVAVSPVDHGISKALYVEDPDGNGVELYVDTREQRDLEHWNGRNERFDPESLGE